MEKLNHLKDQEEMSAWPLTLDYVETFAYWDDAFSSAECDEIIRIGKEYNLREGTVKLPDSEGFGTHDAIRDSKVTFLTPYQKEWIYTSLTDKIVSLNSRFFRFDIWGFAEGLQFTEYNAPGGRYDFHIDRGFNYRIRKLSMVVQLTDPDEYEGGELELFESDVCTIKTPNKKGTLILFPSYVVHRVKPVTKGTRHSLVGWITGAPFR